MYHQINVLELLEIELTPEAFLKDLCKQYIRMFSDNTTAVTDINKQGGIKSFTCNETAKRIWEFCTHNNNHISAAHIPGKHNILKVTSATKR